MVHRAPEIEAYFVYTYEHLDDLSFTRSPSAVFGKKDLNIKMDAVRELLRRHGWEGDGDIRVAWFPPFVDVGVQNTYGTYVWLVKQDNNGTSYIASPHELPFRRLLAQNGDREVWKGFVPFGKARFARVSLVEAQNGLTKALDQDLSASATLDYRGSEIAEGILERAQGRMIQALQSFCDDCYLQLLIDVITNGNRSGIKLQKTPVRLDPSRYMPGEADSDVGGWFTLHGLVSDMWNDYRFLPFDQKITMLFAPLGFRPQVSTLSVLKLHVFLRNCVQHHGGQVEQRGLKRLGRSSIELLGPDGRSVTIDPRASVSFSRPELSRLDREIRSVAHAFDVHVESALVERDYSDASNGAIPEG